MADFDVDAYMGTKSDDGDTRIVVMPAAGVTGPAGGEAENVEKSTTERGSVVKGGKTDDRPTSATSRDTAERRGGRSQARVAEKRRPDHKSRRRSRSVSHGRSRRDRRDRRGGGGGHRARGGRSYSRGRRDRGGGARYAHSRGSRRDSHHRGGGGSRRRSTSASRSRSKSVDDGNDSDAGLDIAQRREKRELLALTRDARTVSVSQLQVKVTEKDLKAYFKSVCKVREIVLLKDKHTKRSKGVAYVELKTLDDVPQALLLDGKPFIFRDGHSGFPISVKGSEAEKNFNHKLQKRLEAVGMQSGTNPSPLLANVGAGAGVGTFPPAQAPSMHPLAPGVSAYPIPTHAAGVGAGAVPAGVAPVNVAAAAAAAAAPMLAAAGLRNNLVKPPPYGRLFVGNLPLNITDDMLRAAFGEFGTVIHAKVSKDTSGISKGIAHVQFSTPEEAAAALVGMNGEMVAGQVLQVKPVTQKPTVPYPTVPYSEYPTGPQAPGMMPAGMPPGIGMPPGHYPITSQPLAPAPTPLYPATAPGAPYGSPAVPPANYSSVPVGAPAVAAPSLVPGSAAAISAAAAAATRAALAAKAAAFGNGAGGGGAGQQYAHNNSQAVDSLNQGRAGGGTGVSLTSSTRSMLMQNLAGGAANEIVSADQQREMQRLAVEQQTRAQAAAATANSAAPQPNGAGPIQGILSQYLVVRNMFDPAEETEAEWDVDIKEDTIAECSKFGKVLHCAVEKESKGFVFLCFADLQAAQAAAENLHGRWFGQRMLQVEFMKASAYKEKYPM
jgi:RNA recognition motif-containing protein